MILPSSRPSLPSASLSATEPPLAPAGIWRNVSEQKRNEGGRKERGKE